MHEITPLLGNHAAEIVTRISISVSLNSARSLNFLGLSFRNKESSSRRRLGGLFDESTAFVAQDDMKFVILAMCRATFTHAGLRL